MRKTSGCGGVRNLIIWLRKAAKSQTLTRFQSHRKSDCPKHGPTLKRQTSQSQHQNGHVRSQSLQNENSEPQYETMSPQPCVLKPFKPETSSLPNNDYWNIFLQKTTCTGKSAKLKTGNLSGMCCSTQSNIPAPQNNQALHKKARTISLKKTKP